MTSFCQTRVLNGKACGMRAGARWRVSKASFSLILRIGGFAASSQLLLPRTSLLEFLPKTNLTDHRRRLLVNETRDTLRWLGQPLLETNPAELPNWRHSMFKPLDSSLSGCVGKHLGKLSPAPAGLETHASSPSKRGDGRLMNSHLISHDATERSQRLRTCANQLKLNLGKVRLLLQRQGLPEGSSFSYALRASCTSCTC